MFPSSAQSHIFTGLLVLFFEGLKTTLAYTRLLCHLSDGHTKINAQLIDIKNILHILYHSQLVPEDLPLEE